MTHFSPLRAARQPSVRYGGFSLVEALIAVGVIVILVVLLLPALDSVRNRARSAGCLSSLRQLYVGATLFAGDNQNALPYNTTSGAPENIQSFWSYQASDYALGNGSSETRELICPDGPWFPGKQVSPYRVGQGNYGMNYYLLGSYEQSTGKVTGELARGRLIRFFEIANASSTPLYFDSGHYAPQQNRMKSPVPAWSYMPGYSANAGKSFYAGNSRVTIDARKGRHGKSICIVFADGSGGARPVEQFVNDDALWTATLLR